jgi:hypothetical protein
MSDRDDQGGEVLRSLPARRPQRRSARRDATAAKPAAAKPVAAKRPAAKRPAAKRPAAKRPPARTASGPKAVRPSAATDAAASTPGDPPARGPEGVELVGTAFQAAGELAQIGLTLGTKALRGAVRRIPRP